MNDRKFHEKTIAIVEDEPLIRDNYTDALQRQGIWSMRLRHVHLPSKPSSKKLPDLPLLMWAWVMRWKAGLSYAESCEHSQDLPIMFLTARDSEIGSNLRPSIGGLTTT